MANEKRLIDANALQQAIDDEWSWLDTTDDYRALVDMQATVDAVEVVHGRWNKRKFEDDSTAYRCSECRTTWIWDTRYCPNCGAKMDGDRNA